MAHPLLSHNQTLSRNLLQELLNNAALKPYAQVCIDSMALCPTNRFVLVAGELEKLENGQPGQYQCIKCHQVPYAPYFSAPCEVQHNLCGTYACERCVPAPQAGTSLICSQCPRRSDGAPHVLERKDFVRVENQHMLAVWNNLHAECQACASRVYVGAKGHGLYTHLLSQCPKAIRCVNCDKYMSITAFGGRHIAECLAYELECPSGRALADLVPDDALRQRDPILRQFTCTYRGTRTQMQVHLDSTTCGTACRLMEAVFRAQSQSAQTEDAIELVSEGNDDDLLERKYVTSDDDEARESDRDMREEAAVGSQPRRQKRQRYDSQSNRRSESELESICPHQELSTSFVKVGWHNIEYTGDCPRSDRWKVYSIHVHRDKVTHRIRFKEMANGEFYVAWIDVAHVLGKQTRGNPNRLPKQGDQHGWSRCPMPKTDDQVLESPGTATGVVVIAEPHLRVWYQRLLRAEKKERPGNSYRWVRERVFPAFQLLKQDRGSPAGMKVQLLSARTCEKCHDADGKNVLICDARLNDNDTCDDEYHYHCVGLREGHVDLSKPWHCPRHANQAIGM